MEKPNDLPLNAFMGTPLPTVEALSLLLHHLEEISPRPLEEKRSPDAERFLMLAEAGLTWRELWALWSVNRSTEAS
jgi:hypothetical protein